MPRASHSGGDATGASSYGATGVYDWHTCRNRVSIDAQLSRFRPTIREFTPSRAERGRGAATPAVMPPAGPRRGDPDVHPRTGAAQRA